MTGGRDQQSGRRPRIAFFDYPDVFEDFYTHYDIAQEDFATCWADTGNHAFLAVLQRSVGDVAWYAFSLKPKLEEARHEVIGCRVKMLRSSWLHRQLWHYFYMPRSAWRWRWMYPAYAVAASYVSLFSSSFVRTLSRERPDVFFVQDYATGRFDVLVALAGLLKIPLIAYHSGSRPEQYVGRLAKHWTIRRATHVIVSSQNELEMLVRDYGISPERASVILTPIDVSVYSPSERSAAASAVGLEPGRRYLLFMGRLDDKVKRVGTIIDTFASLAPDHPDVDLLVVGEGPDADALRRQATSSAGERVRFLGWISDARMKASLYNLAECLLLASKREGFPTVVGEAMCCGTPVIASDVGGISEMVHDDQTGWLFPADDPTTFRNRLSNALSNPDALGEMRARARTLAVDRLSPEAVAAALQECFSSAGHPA